MTKKILTLGYALYGTGTGKPFNQLFGNILAINPRDVSADVAKCDCVVIWGGADISPSIYNEPVHARTNASSTPSSRDVYEQAVITAAKELSIPIIGVCRGAQLVCAMAGGKLVQDVNGHHGDHEITTVDGQRLITSSIHHQMMYPWDVPHALLAWSSQPRASSYLGVPTEFDPRRFDADSGFGKEPEVVYFPELRALAIQGHPEFMDSDCPFVKYCLELVNTYLLTASDVRPMAQTLAEEA